LVEEGLILVVTLPSAKQKMTLEITIIFEKFPFYVGVQERFSYE
jgi:ribosomal protein L31